jgi:hypothetical protein
MFHGSAYAFLRSINLWPGISGLGVRGAFDDYARQKDSPIPNPKSHSIDIT